MFKYIKYLILREVLGHCAKEYLNYCEIYDNSVKLVYDLPGRQYDVRKNFDDIEEYFSGTVDELIKNNRRKFDA